MWDSYRHLVFLFPSKIFYFFLMNQTIKDIISRRSVKKYKPDAVPQELVAEVCKAGTYAPTGMNRQSPIIIAVTNRELRDRISAMNLDIIMKRSMTTSSGHSDPFYGAPVVLVVLARKDANTRVYDGSLVMANMMIAAHSLGLGSCWIHRAKEEFESEEGKQILRDLGVSDEYEGIGHCILGYPADDALKPQVARKDDYIVWA